MDPEAAKRARERYSCFDHFGDDTQVYGLMSQLTREKYGSDVVLIDFTTYHGTVTAASDWGKPAERKRVRPALAGSYEELFHRTQLS